MNFKFSIPVEVFWGKIVNYSDKLCKYGKKALIITDKSSIICGALNDILSILESANICYEVFNEVVENPPINVVLSATRIGIEFKPDFVIAIGGGSSIDTAKASSFLIFNQSTDEKLLFENGISDVYLPIVAIPTTAGSGSEMTSSAILSVPQKNTKVSISRRIKCSIAFIDPDYTFTISDYITTSTALDVLFHLIEGYLSTNSNHITDILIEGGLVEYSLLIDYIKNKQYNNIFREKIMALSVLGGAVISNTRTSLPHLLSYPITYTKKVKHGYACGMVMTEFLRFHKDNNKVHKLLSLIGFDSIDCFSVFLDKECPHIICSENEIKTFTDIVFLDKKRLALHPFDVNYEDILDIYCKSFTYHR